MFLFIGKVKIWDMDFWWHLSTGRYIVENHSLPDKDPFSFTAAMADPYDPAPEREPFILKMYWFSQVIFYAVYQTAGFAGIKALRAALLTLTAAAIWLGMRKKGASTPVSYLFAYMLFLTALDYTGERPQLFSFFFTALTVYILEAARRGKERLLWSLPFVLLLWANMHGGFIMGNCIIGLYMLFEAVKYGAGEKYFPLPKPLLRRLLLSGLAAIAVSFVNPNTYKAFAQTLVMEKYFSGVQELMPPFYFFINKLVPLDYVYLALLFLTVAALIGIGRRDITASALLMGTAAMSLKSSRYVIFFACVSMFFVAPEAERLLKKAISALRGARAISALGRNLAFEWAASGLLFYLLAGAVAEGGILTGSLNTKGLPVRAAEFIKKEHIQGRMFNGYEFGGYLIWALYPEKKVFIDSRGLKIGASRDYMVVINAVKEIEGVDFGLRPGESLWENTLDLYGINFVVTPFLDYMGGIVPLNIAMLESPRWALIYSDHLLSVFIRNDGRNRALMDKYEKTKEELYNSIIYMASYQAVRNKVNPAYLVSLGRVFERAGRPEDARKAFELALTRDPGNAEAQSGLRRLDEGP